MAWTKKEFLELTKVCIERYSELLCEEIDRDIDNIKDDDAISGLYIEAYWRKYIDMIFEINKILVKTDDIDSRLSLIQEIFYEHIDLPSKEMKVDVKNRLEWLKKNVVKRFEQDVRKTIDFNDVVSPIEHIFIMEWKYSRIEDRLHVILNPQTPIETDRGVFTIDFIVMNEHGDNKKPIFAIELDGHDFHEKSKLQVESDKKRERAIIRKGIKVLRFSGSEIVKNARGCIKEIEEYLKSENNGLTTG